MRQRKILGTQLIMAIIAIVIGLKLKIEKSEYGNLVIVLGAVGLMVLYIFRFSRKKVKNYIDYIRLVTILVCGMNGLVIGIRYLQRSWLGDFALSLGKFALVVWLLSELFHLFRKK